MQALPKYEKALTAWAKILADNLYLRKSQPIAEDSYEVEWNYLQLFQATPAAPLLKQQLFAQDMLSQALLPGPDLGFVALSRLARPQTVTAPVLIGPLDGQTKDGDPIIEPTAVSAVLRRKGLLHEQISQPPPGMMGMAGMPPGPVGSQQGRAMPKPPMPPGK